MYEILGYCSHMALCDFKNNRCSVLDNNGKPQLILRTIFIKWKKYESNFKHCFELDQEMLKCLTVTFLTFLSQPMQKSRKKCQSWQRHCPSVYGIVQVFQKHRVPWGLIQHHLYFCTYVKDKMLNSCKYLYIPYKGLNYLGNDEAE